MPKLNRRQRREIQENIKRDVEAAFPGYIIERVIVWPGGDWTIQADIEKSLPDFYHLYPNLTKAQADDQIIKDIEAIVGRHLPDAFVVEFDQDACGGQRSVMRMIVNID